MCVSLYTQLILLIYIYMHIYRIFFQHKLYHIMFCFVTCPFRYTTYFADFPMMVPCVAKYGYTPVYLIRTQLVNI